MSKAAKLTLASTTAMAAGIVLFVHYSQQAEKAVSTHRVLVESQASDIYSRLCMLVSLEMLSSNGSRENDRPTLRCRERWRRNIEKCRQCQISRPSQGRRRPRGDIRRVPKYLLEQMGTPWERSQDSVLLRKDQAASVLRVCSLQSCIGGFESRFRLGQPFIRGEAWTCPYFVNILCLFSAYRQVSERCDEAGSVHVSLCCLGFSSRRRLDKSSNQTHAESAHPEPTKSQNKLAFRVAPRHLKIITHPQVSSSSCYDSHDCLEDVDLRIRRLRKLHPRHDTDCGPRR
jgi:hypothetical protein